MASTFFVDLRDVLAHPVSAFTSPFHLLKRHQTARVMGFPLLIDNLIGVNRPRKKSASNTQQQIKNSLLITNDKSASGKLASRWCIGTLLIDFNFKTTRRCPVRLRTNLSLITSDKAGFGPTYSAPPLIPTLMHL